MNATRTQVYLETRLEEHKTARPGSRRALPVAAPVYGLTQHCWGEDFVVARRSAGLTAEDGSSLVPAIVDGSFGTVPYKTAEFTAAFRSLLVKLGFGNRLEAIGAHSLKATMLSWAAKFGLERDNRRLLGYHAAPGGDATVDVYARDVMATPLRALNEMLAQIRDGRFDPDATRSGAFVPPPAAVGEHVPAVEDAVSMSSAESSASPTASDDEEVTADVECTVVLNTATGYAHIAEDANVLRCGKPWPMRRTLLRDAPAGSRLCRRCF